MWFAYMILFGFVGCLVTLCLILIYILVDIREIRNPSCMDGFTKGLDYWAYYKMKDDSFRVIPVRCETILFVQSGEDSWFAVFKGLRKYSNILLIVKETDEEKRVYSTKQEAQEAMAKAIEKSK